MTVGMGIRVGSKAVHFSVLALLPDGNVQTKLIDKLNIPESLDNAHKLSYIRNNLLSIIMQFGISNAGIRITENTALNVSTFRVYLEGIVQELFVDSSVDKYFLGTKNSIARLLDKSTTEITDYFEGRIEFANFPDIPRSHLEKRESLLTALASIELSR
ncbi:hypothetical protein [Paenibacillus tyrfis]|uniref:Uncharacterized protein n=1 Tax=Paenibacillus tyrfis TaxID=1501230 RepID=A0A081NSZ5_9BACL|nr:hypothetical protein [Paenibacillus tyrfis]KEQ21568.1 hypothetical protein ET33_35380 [Paenibacillus tyrfis]